MNDLVSVLDVDAGLAALVPQERRAEARRATAAATLSIAAGSWRQARNPDRARGGYGLLLVDGMIIRRVGIDGRYGAELLGPGDLLRPWQTDGNVLGIELSWRVVSQARLAVLDPRWAARAAPWPQLGAELAGRALARSVRTVTAMAISQQPKLEQRLWMLFWDLADRYGRVHADGVHIDLPLTHEVLSHLAGARRPSVSGALTRLASTGRLHRAGRAWVLSGDPPVEMGSAA
ncbi:helix-turn-helix domain-containing protein [Candidatus Solirubrobacter pratensis]|uniref:helix-turn-helix domain-containing protein n=1 Tax=Candidatus Solirubrobacter pratensis TaxID=1298857 RepID=UPI000412C10A|nr:Crp/Fnr family transcriptional regulator [Candidatus Solirubrobacter pratensis]